MAKKHFNHSISNAVQTLLDKMTLAQKVGQMTQAERTTCTPDDVYRFHLGSVLSAAGSCPGDNLLQDWIQMADAYWQASTTKDDHHQGIPILYGVDAIHGNNNVQNAVIFPHNIGLGASRDFNLIERIARTTAQEVLAAGVDWVFAPNLALAQDYHWGRTYESFSQDPETVSQFAHHMVTGLQGDLSETGVLACVKHWIGDGGTTHGIDQGNTELSWQQLKKTHIQPYHAAIEAGAMTIMVSFSSWNGDKCHAHRYLLTEVLKNDMQFHGLVISDMQGIDYLADDFYIAVAQGVNAGIDMFMVPDNWQQFIEHLVSHVELGTVPMARIDDAVRRILSVKMAFGLFEKPCPSKRLLSGSPSFGSNTHRQLAREAVRKSLVLLKNENDLLPINKGARLLVCGKNADNKGHQCGGFTVTWQGLSGNDELPSATSIWQGIASCATQSQLVEQADIPAINPEMFDAAIVVIGETPYAEGRGDIRYDDDVVFKSGFAVNGQIQLIESARNSLELQYLHPEDLALIAAIHGKSIPMIVILLSGRPLIVDEELALADSFIAAWLPGSEGQGIADLLFGDHAFSGTLGFAWPQHPPLKQAQDAPLYATRFPVGYGLGYKTTHSKN
ncbi:glycoside hydrolase family 3 protein [Aliiglaciecola sp. LCG003]|uniref:glycoside hydrolase family 3 protein n=1 Tax=Aliiglaciecola sp. LCG003 TaxID=3053655 RepID=UPI00257392ED|nr:glycoside hydrolase family 3 protein [Aliiglaciecola sp. LCG003]WJG10123.1 glycoside hydrolase family 3 protein [Aliiglaciecola sp. LCG003]